MCTWGTDATAAPGVAMLRPCGATPTARRGTLRRSLAGFQPAGYVFGVIGEDNGGSGALDAGHDFEDDALLINPAVARGSLHHRIFGADIVRGDRRVESLTDAGDDVEIRESGLYHDDVRALFEVESDFAKRLAGVGRIHLIAAAVAKLGRGLGSF